MASHDEEYGDEAPLTIDDDAVVTKYKMAAEIANAALAAAVAKAVDGARVVDVLKSADSEMETRLGRAFTKHKDMLKSIAFPTCLSVNECVGLNSPSSDDTSVLKTGDMVKIDLGVQIDGLIASGATTVVVGEPAPTGRAADVLTAAYQAAEAVHRMLRPGTKNSEISAVIQQVADAYGCQPCEGVLSHIMRQFVIDGDEKIIANKVTHEHPVEECTIEPHEVWGIDIVMSTGDGKTRQKEAKTNVYKRNLEAQYQLKMRAARQFFSQVDQRFPATPFSMRYFDDEKTARFGLGECLQHDLFIPYPVVFEKDGELVAQVKFTALVMPRITHRITTPNAALTAQSDKKIENADVLAILARSVKKPHKGAAAANSNA